MKKENRSSQEQQATKDAIAKLLELKKQYKEKTGKEYKPGEVCFTLML